MKGYKIRVTFVDLPTIWRRLVIPGGLTFAQLHRIIQTTMYWLDYHLYEFADEKNRLHITQFTDSVDEYLAVSTIQEADAAPDSSGAPEKPPEIKDATKQRIDKVLDAVDTLTYTYDFGDNWVLDIAVEERLKNVSEPLPLCLDGREASPPEDVGGASGFFSFLEAWHSPRSQEDREWIEWAQGQGFEESFCVERLNRLLQLRVPTGEDKAIEVSGQLSYEFFHPQEFFGINPKVDEDLIQTSHIFRCFRDFLHRVNDNSPLKATQTGNLPRNFVRALFDDGFDYILSFPYIQDRIMGENDAWFIGDLRELATLLGFIKRQKGRFSLTKRGLSALDASPQWLYLQLMRSYINDFCLGMAMETPATRTMTLGRVLTLLRMSAAKEHETTSMAARLFPYVADELAFERYRKPADWQPDKEFARILSNVVCKRWLLEFGLVTVRDETTPGQWIERRFVTKTPLLDALMITPKE